MEKVSLIKINSNYLPNRYDYEQKFVYDNMPRPECRNLSYVDSRCLGLLNPSSLLETIPKQISNPKILMGLIAKNPHLKALLAKNDLKLQNGDFVNFIKFTDEHMKYTARVASRLCDEIKHPIDKARVVKAARLHDVGKIFIPAKILNKPENLNSEEKKLMSAHAELGYTLLETLKIDSKTLDLIKNHHNFDENSSLEQQIVSAADVYSALIENRPYKKSMSSKQAISIMEQSGFTKEIIEALKRITQ